MSESRRPEGKKKKRLALRIAGLAAALGLLAYGVFRLWLGQQMKKIPGLSFAETLEYTLRGNAEGLITVGVIRDGRASYKVYGEDAQERPAEAHVYEIGSLSKTFAAALVSRAVDEGRLGLEDSIDCYLDLPEGKTYPTIAELLTHKAGYKAFYFESPMIANFFAGRNSFYGVSRESVLAKAGSLDLSHASYPFVYSNFGFAVLGLVLEAVYDEDYTPLMNDFLQQDLGLTHSRISNGEGDLGNLWDWESNDAYLPAGGITSTVEDMLAYADMQLREEGIFSSCHRELTTISENPKAYAEMGIRMDAAAMSWIIDRENHIVWHNGGTGHYNCYLGFDTESQTAVVILSNLAPSYRIPATVQGIKLMNELRP